MAATQLNNSRYITYVNKNINVVSSGLLLHGTNCSGGFGAGVAGVIGRKWPIVREAFYAHTPGEHLLGAFMPVIIDENLTIANCYTQLRYGNDGKRYASLNAISEALSVAYTYADDNRISKISMPMIGSGLGGLSWEHEVAPIVEKLASAFDHIQTNVYYIKTTKRE